MASLVNCKLFRCHCSVGVPTVPCLSTAESSVFPTRGDPLSSPIRLSERFLGLLPFTGFDGVGNSLRLFFPRHFVPTSGPPFNCGVALFPPPETKFFLQTAWHHSFDLTPSYWSLLPLPLELPLLFFSFVALISVSQSIPFKSPVIPLMGSLSSVPLSVPLGPALGTSSPIETYRRKEMGPLFRFCPLSTYVPLGNGSPKSLSPEVTAADVPFPSRSLAIFIGPDRTFLLTGGSPALVT